MAESHVYDGDELERVRRESVELTESAELGAVTESRITINDTTGTQEIVGHKDYAAIQSAAEIVGGFVGVREIRRAGERSAVAREIDVTVHGRNSALGFRRLRVMSGMTAAEAGKRPAETVGQRVAWLLASPFLAGLVADHGFVDYPDDPMDAADYRNQFPGDVLADCALAVGCNHFLYRDDDSGDVSLWFRDSNESTDYTSTLRISNVIEDVNGDLDGLTFYPFKDASLRRDPSEVISDIGFAYAKDTVDEVRPATALAFNGERSGTASNANVKTEATARLRAKKVLAQRSTEEDVISCTIQVPAEQVNAVRAGQRLEARFSHLANTGGRNYDEMTWLRVLERTVRPIVADPPLYDLELKLSPQESFAPSPFCASLDRTVDGDYWPLGYSGSGGLPNPSDGVVQYFRAGLPDPVYPIVGEVGHWHFSNFGVGGPGTIDRCGTGGSALGILYFCVVGDGHATIQTEAGSPGLLMACVLGVGDVDSSAPSYTTIATGVPAGTVFEVDVVGAGGSDSGCVSWILVYQSNNTTGPTGWGWSQMTWTRT